MPAEPTVVTNGPLRELAEVRVGNGFAWSCRKTHAGNGELTEIHQITSGDRDEYERHMRGHGLKPPARAPGLWKPWEAPRPTREYKPKPMDPGQRVQWVRVVKGHWEGRTYIEPTDATPARFEGGTRADEVRETRTGVIWSVADTASAWWVQPDEDPAHPVYVRRAGKRERYEHGEGTLYEVPGVAEAARANVTRGEIIRKRGIFPVIQLTVQNRAGYSRDQQTYVQWHSDPDCPRAAGKEPYDRGSQGPAYGYQCDGSFGPFSTDVWTPLHVAQALASGKQPPSSLCPDCITGLDETAPAAPAQHAGPPPDIPGIAAGPDKSTEVPVTRAAPDSTPARIGFSVSLAPPATDGEFLESCARLGDVLMSLVGQISSWADDLDVLGLPPPVLAPLRQVSDELSGARAAAVQAAATFEAEFEQARQSAASGLRITGTDHA
jgi:hypothetical protein